MVRTCLFFGPHKFVLLTRDFQKTTADLMSHEEAEQLLSGTANMSDILSGTTTTTGSMDDSMLHFASRMTEAPPGASDQELLNYSSGASPVVPKLSMEGTTSILFHSEHKKLSSPPAKIPAPRSENSGTSAAAGSGLSKTNHIPLEKSLADTMSKADQSSGNNGIPLKHQYALLDDATKKLRYERLLVKWVRNNGPYAGNASKTKQAKQWAKAKLESEMAELQQQYRKEWSTGVRKRPQRSIRAPKTFEFGGDTVVEDDSDDDDDDGATGSSSSDDGGVKTSENFCHKCGSDGEMFICSTCTHVYHNECLDNPPDNDGVDDWICPTCTELQAAEDQDFAFDEDAAAEDEAEELEDQIKWQTEAHQEATAFQRHCTQADLALRGCLTSDEHGKDIVDTDALHQVLIQQDMDVLHYLVGKQKVARDSPDAWPPLLFQFVRKRVKSLADEQDADAHEPLAIDFSKNSNEESLEAFRGSVHEMPRDTTVNKRRRRAMQYLVSYLESALLDLEDGDQEEEAEGESSDAETTFQRDLILADMIREGNGFYADDREEAIAFAKRATKVHGPKATQMVLDTIKEAVSLTKAKKRARSSENGGTNNKPGSKNTNKGSTPTAECPLSLKEIREILPDSPGSLSKEQNRLLVKQAQMVGPCNVDAFMNGVDDIALLCKPRSKVCPLKGDSKVWAGHKPAEKSLKAIIKKFCDKVQKKQEKKSGSKSDTLPELRWVQKYVGWALYRDSPHSPTVWTLACIMYRYKKGRSREINMISPLPIKVLYTLYPWGNSPSAAITTMITKAAQATAASYNGTAFTWFPDWNGMKSAAICRTRKERDKSAPPGLKILPAIDSRRLHKLLTAQRVQTAWNRGDGSSPPLAKKPRIEKSVLAASEGDTDDDTTGNTETPQPVRTSDPEVLRSSLGTFTLPAARFVYEMESDALGKAIQLANGVTYPVNPDGDEIDILDEDLRTLLKLEEDKEWESSNTIDTAPPVSVPLAPPPPSLPVPPLSAKQQQEQSQSEPQVTEKDTTATESNGPAWISKHRVDLLQEKPDNTKSPKRGKKRAKPDKTAPEPVGKTETSPASPPPAKKPRTKAEPTPKSLAVQQRREELVQEKLESISVATDRKIQQLADQASHAPTPSWFVQLYGEHGSKSDQMQLHAFANTDAGSDATIDYMIQALFLADAGPVNAIASSPTLSSKWGINFLTDLGSECVEDWSRLTEALAKSASKKKTLETTAKQTMNLLLQFCQKHAHGPKTLMMMVGLVIQLHLPKGTQTNDNYRRFALTESELGSLLASNNKSTAATISVDEFDFFGSDDTAPNTTTITKDTDTAASGLHDMPEDVVLLDSQQDHLTITPLAAALLHFAAAKRGNKSWNQLLDVCVPHYTDLRQVDYASIPVTERGGLCLQSIQAWANKDAFSKKQAGIFVLTWLAIHPPFAFHSS
jgi:hypothetical protein